MKPLMTDKPVGIKNVLLVGNSFMFYNCGVNGMINGFAKQNTEISPSRLPVSRCQSVLARREELFSAIELSRSKIASDGTNKVTFLDYPTGAIPMPLF